MRTQYADCEIRIGPRSGDSYPISINAPGGDGAGELRLPTDDPDYQELAARLKNLVTTEEVLITLGQRLFSALFQGQIKERYIASLSSAAQAGQRLRIVLNISANEREVAELPWEFLHDPDQGALALLNTPIVRYLPQPSPIPALKADLPLRVLITGAQTRAPINALAPAARDQTAENIERELREIEGALRGMGSQVQIVVEPHLTAAKLQRLLRSGFQVWHFVGHGSVNAQGTAGRLQFEDDAGETHGVSAEQLKVMLSGSEVRLVVLDSCQSGQLALDPFRSVAPALVRAGVPAVVAMQFSVPQHSARAFAGEFYRALAEGLPIDACVTEGRRAVTLSTGLDRADWGIPVVYTRAPDGRLFDLPARPPRGEQSPIRTPALSERAEEIRKLRALLKITKDRLHEREMQKAFYGIGADPSITMDIENLQAQQAKLEQQISDLEQ